MDALKEIVPGKITRNVSYGPHARQVANVAVPESVDNQTKWVLIVHGGGWRYGNKSWMDGIQKMLYRKGLASFNINYRLAGEGVRYREQLEDVTLAVQMLEKVMQQFGNSSAYFLLGESAGGHLALLYGYQHPAKIAGIISLSSPTDFYTQTYFESPFYKASRNIVEQITGARLDQPADAEIFKQASPLFHIQPVPTLLFQGTKDRAVDMSQATTLAAALEAQGVPHQLVLMKGAGHVPRLLPWKSPAIYRHIYTWILDHSPQLPSATP